MTGPGPYWGIVAATLVLVALAVAGWALIRLRHYKAEATAARHSGARFRKLVENLHSHIVFIHDLHGKFTYMSPSVAEILGYTPAEMMAHYGARMTAESREAAILRQNRLQAGETPRLSFENEYVHKNGTVRELSVSETAVLDGAGRVVGVQGIARDITEERRTARALHRSRRRHALANEAALEGIFEWQRGQGLTHVSPRLRALLGVETDAMPPPAPDDWLARVTPQYHQLLRDSVAAFAAGQDRRMRLEFTATRADGTLLHLVVHLVAERDAGGQVELVVGAVNDVTATRMLEEELRTAALTDALTGLDNRRSFLRHLEREWERVRRTGSPCGFILIDLDNFKAINDRHGHGAGDTVLRHFAGLARRATRQGDLIGRLGGEEFALMLPDCDLAGAGAIAERLRRLLADEPVLAGQIRVSVTFSGGIALIDPAERIEDLIARADGALYRAKQAGRNAVLPAAGPVRH